jgi:hypothetical protein
VGFRGRIQVRRINKSKRCILCIAITTNAMYFNFTINELIEATCVKRKKTLER